MSSGLIQRFDRTVVHWARRHGLTALRLALGIVFVWFGGLKIADLSPVSGLVAEIVPVLSDRTAVLVVGIVEVVVGMGLLTGVAIRVALGLFFLQMLGTFLVLVLEPSNSFVGGNPLRLTVLGEFIVKNLVLLTAGLALAAAVPPARGNEGVGHMLARRARR